MRQSINEEDSGKCLYSWEEESPLGVLSLQSFPFIVINPFGVAWRWKNISVSSVKALNIDISRYVESIRQRYQLAVSHAGLHTSTTEFLMISIIEEEQTHNKQGIELVIGSF